MIERTKAPPETIGEHLRAVRNERGLTQAEAGALMQVSEATVLHWEKDATEPPAPYWPTIIAFLGYEPFAPPATIAERMLAFRRRAGLSIKEAARRAEVDEASWSRWERTGRIRSRNAAAKLLAALGSEK